MEERFWFFDCEDDAARRMVGEVAQRDKHAAACRSLWAKGVRTASRRPFRLVRVSSRCQTSVNSIPSISGNKRWTVFDAVAKRAKKFGLKPVDVFLSVVFSGSELSFHSLGDDGVKDLAKVSFQD